MSCNLNHINFLFFSENDATFLMDHAKKNESYTSLKWFNHRSWKLFSLPDARGPLFFDSPKNSSGHKPGFDLLIIAQPCMVDDKPEVEGE